jgi:hypothetical protein
MITFKLRDFVDALNALNRIQARAHMSEPDSTPTNEGLDDIRTDLVPLEKTARGLAMPTVLERLEWTGALFTFGLRSTHSALVNEIFELFRAIERDASGELFCHYQKDRVGFLQRMTAEWDSVFKTFPSAQREIEEGVDCYALGHNLACVFHMVRVGEIGLRVIGRERGVRTVRGKVPIEWGTWGQVFQAIEPTIEDIRKTKPNGPKKAAALVFYERVLSDLRAIQSLYRDPTMHLRDEYDDGETQSAMFRVRELMTMLAIKLDENSTRAIPWSAWK